MFLRNIQEIIKHIRSTIACGNCKHVFSEKDFEITDIYASRMAVAVCCPKCLAYTTIVMSEEYNKPRGYMLKEHKTHKPSKKTISANEMLDMTTFVRNLKGNFSDIFNG